MGIFGGSGEKDLAVLQKRFNEIFAAVRAVDVNDAKRIQELFQELSSLGSKVATIQSEARGLQELISGCFKRIEDMRKMATSFRKGRKK